MKENKCAYKKISEEIWDVKGTGALEQFARGNKEKWMHWRNISEMHWTSLVVQRLRLHAPNAGGMDLISGQRRSCMLRGTVKKKKKKQRW